MSFSKLGSDLGETLQVDTKTGKILNNIVDNYWKREYAPGWEPKV